MVDSHRYKNNLAGCINEPLDEMMIDEMIDDRKLLFSIRQLI